MQIERSSGVLLHPTSFPGRYGIGELGEEAYIFIDWLKQAGQSWWQVMPLGPTGYGDSPYQSFSAFAGNPYLISLDSLKQEGLLSEEDLSNTPAFPQDAVDYGWIYVWKYQKLEQTYTAFLAGQAPHLQGDFEDFKRQEEGWLDDFALFMAFKATQPTMDPFGNPCMGAPWSEWPAPVRSREPQALQECKQRLAFEIDRIAFYQFLFFKQWAALRRYAHAQGVQIIGDLPIFVALDSADAWANPEQFYFDEQGIPTVVAGVPPDYFSATGQLWGNPLYRWENMQSDGFQWWIRRFSGSLKLYDLIRIDHFRGFEAYWEIPYPSKTAIEGRWVGAPGQALFAAVRAVLGEIPILAEDLGVITPEVEQLREQTGFPGMAVLQFAFSGGEDWNENSFLPQNLKTHQVVYTGTHDNDTTRGWFSSLSIQEINHLSHHIPHPVEDKIAWEMIRLAWLSRADLAITPLQDLFSLGTQARMNLPGKLGGNWQWRYTKGSLSPFVAKRLKQLTEESDRIKL